MPIVMSTMKATKIESKSGASTGAEGEEEEERA